MARETTNIKRAKARALRRQGLPISEISCRLGIDQEIADKWVQSIKIHPDIEFLPASNYVVERMLDMARIQDCDVLYELGCGDARICIRAAQRFGIRCVGIDVDPKRLRDARRNVAAAGVAHLVNIRHCDFLTVNLRRATLTVMYINPDVIVQLVPKLRTMRSGSRILSINYPINGVYLREYLAIAPEDIESSAQYIYFYFNPLILNSYHSYDAQTREPNENRVDTSQC